MAESALPISARLSATGGWIDVAFDGATVTLAAVGPPLRMLVVEPTNLKAQQLRTQERGRYRRMAMDALRAAGAGDELDDAEIVWSYRAG